MIIFERLPILNISKDEDVEIQVPSVATKL